MQTEVWRVRPVMAATAKAEAGEAISAAVLVQVECVHRRLKAARSVPDLTEDASKDVARGRGFRSDVRRRRRI